MIPLHKFKVDKLIRDKLPEIMRRNGIQLYERVMDKDEYSRILKDKITGRSQPSGQC